VVDGLIINAILFGLDIMVNFPGLSFCALYRHLQHTAGPAWISMFLKTPYRITWDYYFSAREHTLTFDSWEEPAELEYI
jgi:hypothetical protein